MPDAKTFQPVCAITAIVCAGAGNAGGNSLAEQKDIKRAKFPPVLDVTCSTKMNSEEVINFVKGDPGSVFTFKCPAGCKDEGTLIGAGLYHVNSSICKSGIQQSMFDNSQESFMSIVIG